MLPLAKYRLFRTTYGQASTNTQKPRTDSPHKSLAQTHRSAGCLTNQVSPKRSIHQALIDQPLQMRRKRLRKIIKLAMTIMYEIAALKSTEDGPYRQTDHNTRLFTTSDLLKNDRLMLPSANPDCFERGMDKRVRKHKSVAQTHRSAR